MKLNIKGTLIRVDKQTGQTKTGGEWQKLLVWLAVGEKQLMVSFFGDKFADIQNLKPGTDVDVVAFLETREWQGKGFTDISGAEIKPEAKKELVNNKQNADFKSVLVEDDLPF